MNTSVRKRRLLIGTLTIVVAVFLLTILAFIALSYIAPLLTAGCVAEVDIDYPITVEGNPETLISYGYPGSEDLAAKIRELNERSDVAAVVFVMNTPGGSVVATREVYDAVDDLEKPSVAYFREVSASGGYYIASGTDYIVSEPYALTGSIGAVVTGISMEGLFSDLGINITSVVSGENKDIGSIEHNMTDDERQILQAMVDEVFEDFKAIVIKNRRGKLRMDSYDEVFDGRIMLGKQAYAVGLVDELGTKQDAINKAAQLAGVEGEPNVCKISVAPQETSILMSLEAFVTSINQKFESAGLYFR